MSHRATVNDRLTWNVVVAAGAVALALLFLGFSIENPPSTTRAANFPLPLLANVLDNLWRSAAMFAFEGEVGPDQNWLLVAGRILAPFATLGGVYRLSADYATSRLTARRIARLRDHMVIIGVGARGRGILESTDEPVAVLDADESTATGSLPGNDVGCRTGDGRDPLALASPRIGWLDGHIWVSGFVSGVSFVARTASGEQLARTDSAAMVTWIDNYCLVNPLDNIARASEGLMEELARRGQ